jgi:sugar/nucleoside kinase (ribokinase family)
LAQYDVLVIGRPQCDLIFTGLERWPEVGQEILAGGLVVTVGGTFNVVAALTRLGLRVGMVGTIGNDEWSKRCLTAMAEEGVSTKMMAVLDRPLPSLSVCMTHAGDRGFLTYDVPHLDPGESCAVNVLLAVEQEEAPFLLCYLTSSVAAYAPIARRRGMTVVADCGWDEAWLTSPELRTLFPLTDVLFANALEACAITGESDPRSALHALSRQVPFVVVKQGAAGASAIVDGREYHVHTEPIEVVDATGAGDCFNAGFLYGVHRRRPIKECLQLGNICGGLAVGVAGGYAGAPTESQLHELFNPPAGVASQSPDATPVGSGPVSTAGQ